MVKNLIMFCSLIIGVVNCSPTTNDGDPPITPILIDSTAFFSINETGSGIRPDPNSSGIILDWNQDQTIRVTDYGLYRTWRTFNGEPFNFEQVSKFANSGLETFADTVKVSTDTTYYYKMTAFNGKLESPFSNIVSYKLLEKPQINSPNQNIVDTLNLKFTWTIFGSSSNFVIKVREQGKPNFRWVYLTQPKSFDQVQDIIYGENYPDKQSKLFIPRRVLNKNTVYEWKISLTSGFTVNGAGNVNFKYKEGSSSAWTTFKTK